MKRSISTAILCVCTILSVCSFADDNQTKVSARYKAQLTPQDDLTHFLSKYAFLHDDFPNFGVCDSNGVNKIFAEGLNQLCRYAQANRGRYAKHTAARQMMEFVLLVRENLDLSVKYYNIYIGYRGILGEDHARVQNAINESDKCIKRAAYNWECAGKCFLLMTRPAR